MKSRPDVPQAIADELLVESRHRCNVCKADVAQIHHIDRIDSKKGNDKSNLIVLCYGCHRRAHLPPSYFERRITKSQLRMYKDQWVGFCKKFPNAPSESRVISYTFLNKPRIESIFHQIAGEVDKSKVEYLKELDNPLVTPSIPFERMMETIKKKIDFFDFAIMNGNLGIEDLELLEGLPIYVVHDTFSHGLKGPQYYRKHGVKQFPYLFKRLKISGKTVMLKITFDPQYIISMTGYVELASHRRRACYGIIKNVVKEKEIVIEIMPLAIGLNQGVWPHIGQLRNF